MASFDDDARPSHAPVQPGSGKNASVQPGSGTFAPEPAAQASEPARDAPEPARDASLKQATYRDIFAVALGYIPLGMGMGMALAGAGIDWWWAPVWAIVLYSGAMQFLLVPLVAAQEPLAAIALATVLLQFRHVFYALAFPLDLVRGKLARIYTAFAVTDEAYALITSRRRSELSSWRIVTTLAGCHLSWIVGCTIGALVGLAVPIDDAILNFVLTALFVVLMIESYRSNRARTELLLAGVIAVLALFIPTDLMLASALGLFTILLVVKHQLNARRLAVDA